MTAPTPARTLRHLQAIVATQWLGATLGLPLLTLFLRHRGGTPTVIGFIMASFFVAGVATQFFVGHLSDRFGRRLILVGGLALYAVASFTFLLPISAPWFTLSRVAQGAAAGAIEVASLSAVAGLFPQEERGAAMSKIFAAQLLGIALGPVVGVMVTVPNLGWAYAAAGAASLVAAVGTLRGLDLGAPVRADEPLPPLQWNKQIVGALVSAAGMGLCIGVYETCWSLLMHHMHASNVQIRLSWTFFCIPWVVLSSVGGRLADHFDRRYVSLFGMLNAAGFLFTYPHIHNVNVLLVVGSCEAIGAALTMPAMSSLLTEGAHDRELGRRQGLSTTANTAALALSSAIAGPLFSVAPGLPFTVIASTAALLALTLLYWWSDVPGRITKHIVA